MPDSLVLWAGLCTAYLDCAPSESWSLASWMPSSLTSSRPPWTTPLRSHPLLHPQRRREGIQPFSRCVRINVLSARVLPPPHMLSYSQHTSSSSALCPFPHTDSPPLPSPSPSLSLCQAASGKKTVLYIGISCGLSAPFVAGQLDHCLSNLETFVPVLVGFNPISFARWGWQN